ncbi:hypothetical protein ACVBEJ_13865 [Porticoccus sp. GXU_MW_L64]
MTPEKLQKIWLEAANDSDDLVVRKGFRDWMIQESWLDSVYDNAINGIKDRMQACPEFFAMHDYQWAIERDSYFFSNEAYLQLTLLDLLIPFWLSVPKEKQPSPIFKNLCIKQTVQYGCYSAIPRCLLYKELNIILVPIGWNDNVQSAVKGLLGSLSGRFSLPVFGQQSGPIPELDSYAEKAASHWHPIIAKAVGDEHGCKQVFIPALANQCMANISALTTQAPWLTGTDKMNDLTAYANIVDVYAIGHELGHHLSKEFLELDGDSEADMDLFAYLLTWNAPQAYHPFLKIESPAEHLCLLSGLLFHMMMLICRYTEIHVEKAITGDNLSDQEAKARFQQWADVTKKRCNYINMPPALQGRLHLFQGEVENYTKAYDQYLLGLVPKVVDDCYECFQTLKKSEKNYDDMEKLEAEFLKALKKKSGKNNKKDS